MKKFILECIEAFARGYRIHTMEVRPGDVLLLKTEHRLSVESVEVIKQKLSGALGLPTNKILILDGGADLGVLRKKEAA